MSAPVEIIDLTGESEYTLQVTDSQTPRAQSYNPAELTDAAIAEMLATPAPQLVRQHARVFEAYSSPSSMAPVPSTETQLFRDDIDDWTDGESPPPTQPACVADEYHASMAELLARLGGSSE